MSHQGACSVYLWLIVYVWHKHRQTIWKQTAPVYLCDSNTANTNNKQRSFICRALPICLCVCICIHTYIHICVCVSQVINNNEVIKSHISAVVVKKGALHDSNQKTQLKSHCSNLGVCHVDLDSLEDWKETVHNFSNVCSLQNVLCGITRELTFGTFYKNHCFLHRKWNERWEIFK